MSEKRAIGPRVAGRASGPRITAAQPTTPPTQVQLGNDRLLAGAREVDIAQLAADPDQPRKTMDPDRLAQLATSIVAHGLLQPVVVRQDGLGREGDMRYSVIAGGRRVAAIRLALERATDDETRRRLSRVPVVVSDSPAAQRRIIQLVENLQREDLNPVEEARALKEIMQLQGLSMEALAGLVHRSQGYVDERLRLLRHEEVEEAVQTGLVTKSAGAAIASINSAEARQQWLARATAGETIRPREVYASKPDRRLRSGGDQAATEAGSGAPASPTERAPQAGAPRDALPHAASLSTAKAPDVETRHVAGKTDPTGEPRDPQSLPDPTGPEAPDLAQAGRTLHLLGARSGDEARARWQHAGMEERRAIMRTLVAEATPDAHALVERVLSAGALLGLSCEAALALLHRP